MTFPTVFLHGFLGGSESFRDVIESLEGVLTSSDVLCPVLTGHAPKTRGAPPTPTAPASGFPSADFETSVSESTGATDVLRSVTSVGASDKPEGRCSAEDNAFAREIERLASLVLQWERGPVDIVGYSMGGRFALGLAITFPQLIRKVVLISSRRGLDTERERAERRAKDETWATLLEQEGLETFLSRWWAQPLFESLREAPATVVTRELERRKRLEPGGIAWSLRHHGLGCQPSYAEEVKHLALPVSVVAARKDKKFLELGEQLVSELPNGRLTVVNGCGHHLPIEAPGAIGRAIAEELL